MITRRKMPKPRPCDKPGCSNEDILPCFMAGAADSALPTAYLCSAHREQQGFCVGCGTFSAGIESFDCGRFRGYCDTCADEIEAEDDDFRDDDLDDTE